MKYLHKIFPELAAGFIGSEATAVRYPLGLGLVVRLFFFSEARIGFGNTFFLFLMTVVEVDHLQLILYGSFSN